MKVLIVDDSVVYRSKIRAALAGESWIEIVAAVGDGKSALELIERQPVDMVTLDLEMPVMSGMETLKRLKGMANRPKVIVFSSASRAGSETTLEALACGANDFVAKPAGSAGSSAEDLIRADLIPKLRQFLVPISAPIASPGAHTAASYRSVTPSRPVDYQRKTVETFLPSVVVIASSTGGPSAHDQIFRDLKGSLRIPILIAQHMPPVFTTAFAKRIGSYAGLPSREAKHDEALESAIYVAPGDFHMTVARRDGRLLLQLDKKPPRNSVRPAADPLFESAAQLFGSKTMAFVLTGMGEDGMVGARAVKEAGGGVMIQNRETCVVYGMPGAVESAALCDASGSLEEIGRQLKRMVMR